MILNPSLVKYLKNDKQNNALFEGGNAVKNAEPIRGDLALPIAKTIIKKLKEQFHCEASPLGSTGKKGADQYSGDIDIAITIPWEKKDEVEDFVSNNITKNFVEITGLKIVSIGYSYTVPETKEIKIVQVDLMFVNDLDYAIFSYHSPNFIKHESEYKGAIRNLLMSACISQTPIDKILPKLGDHYGTEYFDSSDYDGQYEGEVKSFWKFSLNKTDGVSLVKKSFVGKTKPLKNSKIVERQVVYSDIDDIIRIFFGKAARRADFNSYESLMAYISSDKYKFHNDKQVLMNIFDVFMHNDELNDEQKQKVELDIKYILEGEQYTPNIK